MAIKITREQAVATPSALPSGLLENLPQRFYEQGTVIYKGRNEIRTLQADGQTLVIKKFGMPPIFNRIFYSLGWRTPKARRSYYYAKQLLARGLQTPQPLAYQIYYRGGLLQDSYFVSSWAAGEAVGSACDNQALVEALARYTARLHEQGLMHRDYILNNVLYTQKDGQYQFELIDINRFVFSKGPLGWWRTCVNLMQPFREDEQVQKFVTHYARARHLNEKKWVWWVLRFRHARNMYSRFKRLLRKLPGAQYFSAKAKRERQK